MSNTGKEHDEDQETQRQDEYAARDIAKWEITPWKPEEQTGGNQQQSTYHHIRRMPTQPTESMGNAKWGAPI